MNPFCPKTLLAICVLVFLPCALSAQSHREELRKLQPKIDKAIDKGVSYLLSLQQRDGSWAHRQDGYRNGMTSLALYTLLKCDVPATHPAVVRALAFLEQKPATKTYSLALQMMAYEALHDPRYKKKIGRMLKTLLEWQKDSWGYPDNQIDLSNTQYAALGLRAAHLAGHRIPKRSIRRLLDHIFDLQNPPERKQQPEPPKGVKVDGYDRSRREYALTAGFRYRMGPGDATGSMTTAGLGVLAICELILGERAPRDISLKIKRSMEMGINWMRCNWSIKGNPGRARKSSHHHYYLYGLERVGSLLMEEILADHPWYYEGAKYLVKNQSGSGRWADGGKGVGGVGEHTTCFGLLFLKRATNASLTGKDTTKRGVRNYRAVDESFPVSIRGAGDAELTLWIEGFSYELLDRHRPKPGAPPRLQILRVEWLVDGKVVKSVNADGRQIWRRDTYATKYRFPKKGKYKVTARVHALAPRQGRKENTVVYEAPGFTAEIDEILETWMEEEMKTAHNLFAKGKGREFDASSQRGNGERAELAFDGHQGTVWASKNDDAEPWVRVRLKKAVRARELVFGQACRNSRERHRFDRVRKIRVELNGNKRRGIEIVLSKDPLQPTVYILPKPTTIGSLRVRIVERAEKGKTHPGSAGFAEIIAR